MLGNQLVLPEKVSSEECIAELHCYSKKDQDERMGYNITILPYFRTHDLSNWFDLYIACTNFYYQQVAEY